MAVFENTDKMYEVLGRLFRTLLNDSTVGPKYLQSGLCIKFVITDPTGEIWLTNKGEVICGAPSEDMTPDVEMTLSGDTCHDFWLKRLSMPVALAKGKIKSKGPITKVLALLPLLKPAYEAYPDIARSRGLY
jgi:hypothetical protein